MQDGYVQVVNRDGKNMARLLVSPTLEFEIGPKGTILSLSHGQFIELLSDLTTRMPKYASHQSQYKDIEICASDDVSDYGKTDFPSNHIPIALGNVTSQYLGNNLTHMYVELNVLCEEMIKRLKGINRISLHTEKVEAFRERWDKLIGQKKKVGTW